MLSFPRLKNHRQLSLILLIYFVIATAHSVVVPLTTGNDEWAHFLYIRFIAEPGRLPANPAERDEAGYKSDAPPLYHLLVSGLTSWVEPTRLLRPLDTPRRYLADNIVDSYALVHTAVEQFPYRGEVLIWHLGRGLSIIFGLATIGLSYQTSLTISHGDHRRAAQVAALVAFLPAFLFHSSVLSYESLSAVFSAAFLLVALKVISQPNRWVWWLILGVVAGLSITTKYSAVLLPFEIIFIGWLSFRMGNQRYSKPQLLIGILLAGLAMMVAISWWFGFVIRHFNTVAEQGPVVGVLQPILVGDASDTTSVEVAGFLFGDEAIDAVSRPPQPRNYPQLILSLLESFWSAPVAGQFPHLVSPWLPLLFTLIAILGLAGLWRVWKQADTRIRTILLLLIFHTGLILPLLIIRIAFSFDPREVAQGRHILMPAASAIAILLVWGWEQWSLKIGWFVIGGLLLWSVLVQLVWAGYVYPQPISVWPGQLSNPKMDRAQSHQAIFAESIRLNAVSWQEGDDTFGITLWWESLAITSEDYLVELTVLDESGQVASYGLGHPVQGRYPTRAWEPGDIIRDTHSLPLANSLVGDYQLQLRLLSRSGQLLLDQNPIVLGGINLNVPAPNSGDCKVWYPSNDLLGWHRLRPRSTFILVGVEVPVLKANFGMSNSGNQMPLRSVDDFHVFIVGDEWPAAAELFAGQTSCGQIFFDIPAREFVIPNIPVPLEANFNNEIQLLGYALPARRIQPGERLPLTLYWRALDYMGEDYRLFANPLDAEQHRWGGYDRRPRDGYSTLRWVPSEVISDPFGIPIDSDAPHGVYTIDFGFYRKTETGAESLPLLQDDQDTGQRSIRLGPIKVGGPPPDVVIDNPTPQKIINQSFGGQITLLGYDLTGPESKLETKNIKLTLYWQADTVPAADYTTFFHLRDGNNELVAQKDRPPASGRYPTSLWDAGEIIVDEIVLPIDEVPPGEYTPVIGLYDFNTSGPPLPVEDNLYNELHLESIILP